MIAALAISVVRTHADPAKTNDMDRLLNKPRKPWKDVAELRKI